MYVTPRTLLGIIRLAQAMAKLNFRDTVKQGDVDEAIRLMDFSIRSLRTQEGSRKEKKARLAGHQQQDHMTHLMH
jgi:DNA replication licensing factor MCM7